MHSRQALLDALIPLVGPGAVLHRPEDTRVYAQDGSNARGQPDVVVFPTTPAQAAAVIRAATALGVPTVPWGAGTGLCGGAVAARGGVTIATSRMRRIVQVDTANRFAIVEPGVVNLQLSQAVAQAGYVYAPDPSSQAACTIGGNVATNAGGPHCLAYGVTANHVLGVQVALEDGRLVWLGGPRAGAAGYDLRALFLASEGTLGLITQICVRLMPKAAAVRTFLALFPTVEAAGQAVSDIIGAGIIPAALEMMDALAIRAVETVLRVGYPQETGAVLLVELEGLDEGMDALAERVTRLCRQAGAVELRAAATAEARAALWKGRKSTMGALGVLAPNYYLQDGVVPRSKLPEVLAYVGTVSGKYGLPIVNVLHAGDGNLHPTILFDGRAEGIWQKVHEAGAEILRHCVEAGGTISGEHGIGTEKAAFLPWLFSEHDRAAMHNVRRVFAPRGLCNPGKMLDGVTGPHP